MTTTNIDTKAATEFSLYGDKVKLEHFIAADINDAYISWLNDSVVVKYSNQRFLEHNQESCSQYLSSFDGTANMFLSIRQLPDNQAVGTMTVYISNYHGTADMGIMVGDKSVWGAGYGQDAWDTIAKWLLKQKDIRKITAGTLACNVGMIKLLERSNMTLEAVRKEQEVVGGKLVDILYYSKFNDA